MDRFHCLSFTERLLPPQEAGRLLVPGRRNKSFLPGFVFLFFPGCSDPEHTQASLALFIGPFLLRDCFRLIIIFIGLLFTFFFFAAVITVPFFFIVPHLDRHDLAFIVNFHHPQLLPIPAAGEDSPYGSLDQLFEDPSLDLPGNFVLCQWSNPGIVPCQTFVRAFLLRTRSVQPCPQSDY